MLLFFQGVKKTSYIFLVLTLAYFWPLSHVMIWCDEMGRMIPVADGCVAISGSQRKREYKTGLFLSQKKLHHYVYEGDRERKAPKESVLEVFCPLPGLLPEWVME